MNDFIASESNRLKQEAGKDLEKQLTIKFRELVNSGIIESFESKVNFSHQGFTYKKQYLANFIIKTLDDKFIVINCSNSFRQDRVKIQNWDLLGINQNANISQNVIASILLYPDEEKSNNSSFNSFREKIQNHEIYTPATHTLVLTELLEFLENHQAGVESELEELEKELKLAEENETDKVAEQKNSYTTASIKLDPPLVDLLLQTGSQYGKAGNKLEKIIVNTLNNRKFLQYLKSRDLKYDIPVFKLIIMTIANHKQLDIADITNIFATDQIIKLKNGGNAKTDVKIHFTTIDGEFTETLSIKNTKQSSVSCHDYSINDFLRVLNCEGTKLGEYFELFQKAGSHGRFKEILPSGYSPEEFKKLLAPHVGKLTEWACTGRHDKYNLIAPDVQTSNYILINQASKLSMSLFDDYIMRLFSSSKLSYGVPLGWTYPSKQRGKRIQFKLPILN